MTTFRFDVAVRRVGDPQSGAQPTTLELMLNDLPAPVRAVLAAGAVERPGETPDDAARERVLREIVTNVSGADAIGWNVSVVALGHLINWFTGQWTYVPDGTVFELLKDDAPYQHELVVAGRNVRVAYQIGVRS